MEAELLRAKKAEYYPEMTLLRGLAIFAIVWTHFTYDITGLETLGFEAEFNGRLIAIFDAWYRRGGSWLFVFISGFLFYGVFYSRGFDYKKFVRGKFLKVFLPYLFFVAPFIILRCLYFEPLPENIDLRFAILAAMAGTFWYIPFIMCVFIMSPLFIYFIESGWKLQLCFFAAAVILGLGTCRHPHNPVFGALYFSCAYLLGIILCQNWQKFLATPLNSRYCVFFLAIVYSCIGACNFYWWGEFTVVQVWKFEFFNHVSGMVILKLAVCALFVWLCHYLAKTGFKSLKKMLALLAEYSFTIFFFQNFLWFYANHQQQFIHDLFKNANFWITGLASFAASLAICFGTIMIFYPIKKLLGRHSRMIIGC